MSSSSQKTRDDDGIGTVLKVVLVHDVVFGGGRSRYGAHVVSSEARKTREENERVKVVVVSDQERKRRLKYD